jgi:rhodanese-related sulfurtransferase
MTTALLPRFRRIQPAAAADLILRNRQGVLPELAVYDARDRMSFERAHIRGAERLDDYGLSRALRELPKRVPVVVYCYHGHASQTYAATFADFRFAEVYSVDGGFEPLAAALAEREHRDVAERSGRVPSGELSAFLEQHGFDHRHLDSPREHGLTPLMRAALDGRSDLVEALLSVGVDLRLRNADGNTALWLACVSNDVRTTQILVDAGIDIDGKNDTGATALMYAASTGKDHLVDLLLRAGADPTVRNQDDFAAVDLASTWSCLVLLRHRTPV